MKLIIFVVSLAITVSGCVRFSQVKEKKSEIINPFSPSSMVNIYNNSKIEIDNSVKKENNKLKEALIQNNEKH